MDHGDDRRTDQGPSEGGGGPDAPEAQPGRVRIIGAERAFETTAVVPVVSRDEPVADDQPDTPGEPDELDDGRPSVRLTDQPGHAGDEGTVDPIAPGGTAVPRGAEEWTGTAVLPHWTEPPTGQVPAILERDRPDGGVSGPTWREEHADWEAHDQSFDAALLAPEEDEEIGSLDESGGADLDRRPWEFDLPQPEARGWADEATQSVPPVAPEPADRVRAAGGDEHDTDDSFPLRWGAGRAGADEGGDVDAAAQDEGKPVEEGPVDEGPVDEGPLEEVFGTARGRPSGTVPVGRMRRGSLRVPRVRAKRPEDAEARFDEPPLAATPPGAAVTAVPGAGRRRGGIVDLAAADREEARRAQGDGAANPAGPGDEGLDADADRYGEAGPETGQVAAVGDPWGAGPARDEPVGSSGRRTGDPDEAWQDEVAARWDEVAGRVDPPARRGAGRRRGRGGAWAEEGGEEEAVAPVPRREGRSTARSAPGEAHATRPRRIPPVEEPGARSSRSHGAQVAPRGGGAVTRVVTGLVAAAVALAAFAGGAVTSLVLVAVVVTFAAGEAYGALRSAGYRPATLLGLVGTVALLVGAYTKGPEAVPLVLVVLVAFSFVWYLFGVDHSPPLAGVASTVLVVAWISLMGAFGALLLAPSAFPHRHGVAFLLGAIIATVANDVGALAFGAWLGRHPLAPRVSPNKTWEGLIGGTVVSVVVSIGLVGAMHPWTASSAAVLGVVVSIVAPIGDLSESLLKRDLRVKDMGRLLPGHGGVLDRIDAMLFVLPATYYLVRVLKLG
ncbi:MAG: phosphatidate cytidylyltransferase [Actinomycetota bacterium]|nr:phosphatidate cytidylyltransferase [Actinomycetota bacterium]